MVKGVLIPVRVIGVVSAPGIICETILDFGDHLIGMALRKAVIFSSTLTDNAGSFVNVTADRLHIRLLDLQGVPVSGAAALGDAVECSIDEVPVSQAQINDSRSHIMSVDAIVEGGTGAIELTNGKKVLAFNREDLVLDPDEAIFMNNADIAGTPPAGFKLNVWYED